MKKIKSRKSTKILSLVFGFSLLIVSISLAGDLNAPSTPDSSDSAMYTVEDLYQRLLDGTPGSKRSSSFTEPSAGPNMGTMHNLNDLMIKMPNEDDINGAIDANVLHGKKYWGVTSGEWGLRTGNLVTQTLSATSANVSAGHYAATTLTAIDEDLVSANIIAGKTIFGVAGKTEVVDTTSGDAIASDIMSGKIAWIDGLKITGNLVTQTLSATSANVSAGHYAATTLTAIDEDLVSANIIAGKTIFGVAGKTEVVDTTSGDAIASDIMSGKIAWIDGGEVTGNILTRTLSATNANVSAGYYSTTTLTSIDADLVSTNIRAGIDLFGISGNSNVVNTSSGDAATATVKFGKKAWVDGKEITGSLAGGVFCNPAATYSSGKRWCNNGNGTITDTTTGLVWYHNAFIFDGTYASCSARIAYMSDSNQANLSDGSTSFEWRMPTVNEMLKITSGVEPISPTNQYLFTGIQNAWYWTCNSSPNPVPLKKMKVQMPESNNQGYEENLLARHYALAVRGPL